MIIEYNKEFKALYFSVKDKKHDLEGGSFLLEEALERAIAWDIDTIEVLELADDDAEPRLYDTLDVNQTLKECFPFFVRPPLQYSHVHSGGYEVVE